MKILFLNYELGYEAGPRLLIGWSTQTYGTPSCWNPTLAAQACEVEVKDEREYLLMLRDIAAAWHLPLRRWLPVPPFPAADAPPVTPPATSPRGTAVPAGVLSTAVSAGGTPASPTGKMPVPRPTRSRARQPIEA